MTAEERKAMGASLMAECKAKESGTDADVNALLDHQIPTTKSGKCLAACLGETTGIVKDGKPSIEGSVNLAKMAFEGNEKAISVAREVATECGSIADADRCELAGKMMNCMHEAFTKRGINPEEI